MKKILIFLLFANSVCNAQIIRIPVPDTIYWYNGDRLGIMVASHDKDYNQYPYTVIDSTTGNATPGDSITIHARTTDIDGDATYTQYRFGYSADSLGAITWLTDWQLDSVYTIPDSLAGDYPYMAARGKALTGGRTGREVYAWGDSVYYPYDTVIFSSIQPSTINQLSITFQMADIGDTAWIDWGEDSPVLITGTTDQIKTSDYSTTNTTYEIKIYGDIDKITKFYVSNEATLSDVKSSELRKFLLLSHLTIYNAGTDHVLLSSELRNLPLTYFRLYNSGTNHVLNSADFAEMPLTYFQVYNPGTNQIINSSDFIGKSLTTFYISNCGTNCTINTAHFIGMPLTYFRVQNCGTNHTGQISDLSADLTVLWIQQSGTGIDITSGTMPSWADCNIKLLGYTGGEGGDCDAFLNAYSETAGEGAKTIDLSDAARTAASDDAVNILLSLQKTIETLGLTEEIDETWMQYDLSDSTFNFTELNTIIDTVITWYTEHEPDINGYVNIQSESLGLIYESKVDSLKELWSDAGYAFVIITNTPLVPELIDTLINPYAFVDFENYEYISTIIHQHNGTASQEQYDADADSGIVCFGYSNYLRHLPDNPVFPDDYYGSAPIYPASRWGVTLPVGTIEIPNSEQGERFSHMVIPGSTFGAIGHNVKYFNYVDAMQNPMVWDGSQETGDTLSLNLDDFVDSVKSNLLYDDGGGIFIAHNQTTSQIITYLDIDTIFLGMSIYNDWRDAEGEPQRGYYLTEWDNINNTGRVCWGIGEQDYFYYGYIVLLAENITEYDALKAIREGVFYTKLGFSDLKFDSIVATVDSVKIYTTGADEIKLITEDGVVAAGSNTIKYELGGNEIFIRAEGRFEGNGILPSGYEDEIYSNPIYLKITD